MLIDARPALNLPFALQLVEIVKSIPYQNRTSVLTMSSSMAINFYTVNVELIITWKLPTFNRRVFSPRSWKVRELLDAPTSNLMMPAITQPSSMNLT